MGYIKLIRMHQWVKNLFVFAPMFFSFDITVEKSFYSLIAFGLFTLIAVSIYILNDYMDIEADRNHPTKKFRPLASGEAKVKPALLLMVLTGVCGLACSYIINRYVFYTLLFYFVMNILYSIKLKHIPVLDVFIISVGFVLRIFCGSFMVDTEISMWIVMMTFLLAIFIGVAKRRDDVKLAQNGMQTRKSIDGYNLEFVNAAMVSMSAVLIVIYILYTISTNVISRMGTEHLSFTSVFVILGVLRYMQLTFVEEVSGSPTKIVLKDRFLQIIILLWLGSFYTIAKYL